MAVHGREQPAERGDQGEDDPGALEELRRQHDEEDRAGRGCAERVNRHRAPVLGPPARGSLTPPVHDHAGLGQGEGAEGAHREQRYEPVRHASEGDE